MGNNWPIKIVGIGSSMASRRISNEDLEERLGMSAAEMERKTGVKCRFRCDPAKENLYVLMASAASQALDSAHLSARDIGGVFSACNPTGELLLPNTGSVVASLLDLPPFYNGGNSTGCSGGLTMLGAAFDRLSVGANRGKKKNYLVLAGDQTSSIVRPGSSDEMLFSDGASALVVSSDNSLEGYYGVNCVDNQTFHENAKALTLRRGGTFLEHDGRSVYGFATRSLTPVLDILGISRFPDDAYLIPHQANLRIIEKIAKDLPSNLVYKEGITNLGNTSPASVLLGLEDVNRRSLSPKSRLILATFGEGLTIAVSELRSSGKTLPGRLDEEELKARYMEVYKSKWL